jgi:hypothetical protein
MPFGGTDRQRNRREATEESEGQTRGFALIPVQSVAQQQANSGSKGNARPGKEHDLRNREFSFSHLDPRFRSTSRRGLVLLMRGAFETAIRLPNQP